MPTLPSRRSAHSSAIDSPPIIVSPAGLTGDGTTGIGGRVRVTVKVAVVVFDGVVVGVFVGVNIGVFVGVLVGVLLAILLRTVPALVRFVYNARARPTVLDGPLPASVDLT